MEQEVNTSHPPYESLDWSEIVSRLKRLATSEVGRQQLSETQPLRGPDEAYARFEEVKSAVHLVIRGQRPHMESLDLYSTWHHRLEKEATLKTLELKDVRHFCIEAMALKELLTTHGLENDWCKNLLSHLMDPSEPLSAIDQIMTPDGSIRTDASETLFQLYREKQDHTKNIQNILDRIVKAHNMEPVLQDKYVTNREGRWVLPVKSGMQHSFDGIIHAASQSKQTVFMEPGEIIPINNRLRQVDGEIEEEIDRLLSQLSKYLFGLLHEIESTREILLECDTRMAQGQLSLQIQGVAPKFSEGRIDLRELKHPLLILNGEECIPNTVQLNKEQRILLLSGPNAGGKTVLLKSVGLAAQMARCGLLIPAAPESQLPFFYGLHVSVGDAQNVGENLSTFAGHLKILNSATKATTTKHLVLIDEICSSTDPEEGAALARSFINTYAENGVFAVITSHLGALKSGWGADTGVINGSLEFDSEKGPTYRFYMGVPGQSLAIQTARRVGVDDRIIRNALEHLSPEKKQYEENLAEVESIKEDLRQARLRLEEERALTKKERERYEKLHEKFNQEREQMLEQSLKRAERRVDKMIQSAKVDETFKKHTELQRVRDELPEVVKAPARAPAVKLETAEDFAKSFPPGSRVFVQTLNQDGTVQGKPNAKGEVPILANSMRLTVDWKTLRPPENAPNPTKDILRKTSHYSYTPVDTDRSVDLRGLSVEEAIESLEVQLDAASLAQEERVKIIHGHGTETLKKAVRSYLSRCIYVKKWRAGTKESGGDGLTWVEIKD